MLLLVGLATERGLIRFYYARPKEDQILVTFGLGIMMVEAVRYVFGGLSQRVPLPSWGQGIVNFGFFIYPLYRVEVIGIVAAAAARASICCSTAPGSGSWCAPASRTR